MRTFGCATALLTMASVAAVWGAAFAAAPTQADFDACNREAQAVTNPSASPGKSSAPGTTSPGMGAGGSASGGVSPSGDLAVDSLLKGMAAAGKSDPAYRQVYLDCLKRRGF